MKVWWPDFNVQQVLLSRATGSVSNGNLYAFDVICNITREIAGGGIVTIGNVVSCSLQHHNLKAKTSSPKFRHAWLNW